MGGEGLWRWVGRWRGGDGDKGLGIRGCCFEGGAVTVDRQLWPNSIDSAPLFLWIFGLFFRLSEVWERIVMSFVGKLGRGMMAVFLERRIYF